MVIDKFKGKYDFLSNFYLADVEYEGIIYQNNEAAFQAQKVTDYKEQEQFWTISASEAKKLGRKVKLRPDWERVKDEIMYEIVRAKFSQNEDLKQKLINTGDVELIEGNIWNDTYWGICKGKGKNMLGKILMRVREEIKEI